MYEVGNNPLAYIPFASALRKHGALNRALEVCKEGLIHDSYSVTGRTLLARILYDMARYDRALEELGVALQLAPDAFGANLLMARILAKKREFHEALDILENVKKMNPFDTDLLELEARLHSKIFSIETKGDADARRKNGKEQGLSLDERINELLEHLRKSPGVIRFNFSKKPTKEEAEKAKLFDPAMDLYLTLDGITGEKGVGGVKSMIFEMEGANLLIYSFEGSLLNILLEPGENIGKLKLQIESLLED